MANKKQDPRPMTVPDERACRCTTDPVCPYCGCEQGDFWEVSGEHGEYECGHCGRTFMWSRYVDITYNTRPIIGPHRLSEFSQKEDAEAFPNGGTDGN